MEDIDYQALERANPIIHVAVELGIKVQAGMARCFRRDRHPEDTEKPTLVFNPSKNSFRCRSCPDVGGTVIDLVCQHHSWDREKALEWLIHRAEFDHLTQKLYHGKGKKK